MTMFRAILPAALLLTACSASQAGAQGSAQAAPDFRAIGFEIKSWGNTLSSWEVDADGSVRHVKIEGSPFGEHRVEHREFTVDPAAYARLVAIVARLPTPRPDRAQCKERATDLPYGTLRLSRGKAEEAIAFDTGCLDASYKAFVDQLGEMDDLVGAWAEQHPVSRVEQVEAQ